MTIEDLCKQVLELDQASPKGPWDINRLGEITFVNWNGIKRIGEADIVQDAKLMAHYRTAAPLLAKACLRMYSELEAIGDYDILSEVEEMLKENAE